MSDILVIDIGGTHIKVAAVQGGAHRELGKHYPTASLRNSDPIESFAQLIEGACLELGIRPEAIVSTVPGFVDPDLDFIHFAGNVPELNGRRLATELSARLGTAVYLERDSILLLRGEWVAGAGQTSENLLGLFFGTGVGGAFLQDGRPLRGSGFAMEIGSMPFKGQGRTLEGLRPDCLETYVSGRVLADIARRHSTPIQDVFVEAPSNSALKADIDEFVRDMAMAVGVAVSLLSPDTTVVGGGICNMKNFPLDLLKTLTEEVSPLSETANPMKLKWAELGWMAAAHGAVLRVSEGSQISQTIPPQAQNVGLGR